MYDLYEMIYKGKIWLLIGIMGMITGLGFILMVMSIDSYSDDGFEGFVLFLGIVFVIFSICSLYHWKHFKEKISYDTYSQMYFIRKCKALCDKRSEYVKAFVNDDDYFALKELYDKLPGLYNTYGSEVLTTPLRLTQPVSPYTAALIGTQIGGAAVGVVAAQNAIDKRRAYEKNVRDVIESSIRTGNAFDKVSYCYESIESIIRKKPDVRENWANEKEKIDSEIKKQYRIS